jgi:diguanylate cyclase (GGDEF)-like protein
VLIMMESVLELRQLESLLSQQHFRVIPSDSSRQGLALALEYLPDLILLDASLTEPDGLEVCVRLKADPRTLEIPVLLVSARQGEIQEGLALEAGIMDFIPKPITSASVTARVRNLLELKRSKERLRALSFMDGLTGIGNRWLFDQRLQQEWQRHGRNGRPLSLVLGDVDFFQSYNEHFGHVEGDRCLQQVAQVFKRSLRGMGALAARFGGEEFMGILPDTDEAGARALAEAIQAGMEALDLAHPESAVSPKVTLSLGVATVRPKPSANPNVLVEEAARSVLEAKRRGRNAIVQKSLTPRRIPSRLRNRL